MKEIKAPATVEISINTKVGKQKNKYPFKQFIFDIITQHEPFGQGLEGAMKGKRLIDAFDKEKKKYSLEDADHQNLKQALKTAKFIPEYNIHLIDYYKAIK